MTDPSAHAISLDDVIALNDEIAALSQAGVPLALGLTGSSTGQLADISGRLANRVSGGLSVSEAIDAEKSTLPRIYRFVLEAGIRAGRLSQAIESLSSYSRTLVDLRRRITLSVIYPVILLVTAYYLFWYFTGQVVPNLLEMSPAWSGELSGWTRGVLSVHHAVETVRHIPPLALVLILVWWIYSSRRPDAVGSSVGGGIQWLPGMQRTVRGLQLANFSAQVAILLDHDVEPAEALRLAAESCGERDLIADANRLAAAVEQGSSISAGLDSATSIPPFMKWMIRASQRPDAWAASFRQLATIYRQRATSRNKLFNSIFPVVLTLLVGGGAVLVYALALFLPVIEILNLLSAP